MSKLLLVLQTLQEQSRSAVAEDKLNLEIDGGSF